MKLMVLTSKITKATTKSQSGRTTIPKEIMEMKNLKIGDSIRWIIEAKDDKIIVTMEKNE